MAFVGYRLPALACVGRRGLVVAFIGYRWPAMACVGRCGPMMACVGCRGPLFTKVEYRRIIKKTYLGSRRVSRAPVAAARAVADIGASAGGAGGAVDTRVVVLSEGWRARV